MWAWGTATNGQLGGLITNAGSPRSTAKVTVSDIDTGSLDNVVTIESTTGRAYAWGRENGFGQLGINSTAGQSSPTSVVGGRSFNRVASGQNHTVAIEGSTGRAYAWGANGSGMLGDNTTVNKSSPSSVTGARSFSRVAAGLDFTVATEASTGRAYTWGVNFQGVLGDNSSVLLRSSPVSVVGARSFSRVAAGTNHISAIEGSTGRAYSWGYNAYGQIGDNSFTDRSSPISVVGGRSFREITSGASYTVAIEGSTGNAYAWGMGTSGQLGDNTNVGKSSPISVVGGRSFSQIHSSNSSDSVIAIEGSTGNAYAWGLNSSGQLGDDTLSNRSSPNSVVGGRSFNRVVMGSDRAFGYETSSGVIYMWGNVVGFALDVSNSTSFTSPVSVNRIFL